MKSKNKFIILIGCVLVFSLAFTFLRPTPIYFQIPKGWPKPNYDFSKNPLTEEGFQLGRQLFYDPILSRDSTISCASCHLQATGFTHVDHDLSHGIDGRIGMRNSMTLMNLAWSKSFMWDGGVPTLDRQAIAPMTDFKESEKQIGLKFLEQNKKKRLQEISLMIALLG